MTSKVRLSLIAVAIVATCVAALLWWVDGAWLYGAMPTKGLIRTALIAGAGCGCLGLAQLAQWISHRNDTKV